MIGTTAAILGAAAVGAVGSLAAGALGASAADKAATTQAGADVYSADLQNKQFEQNRTDTLPWLEAGKKALVQYQGELGLNKTNADGTPFTSQFKETPSYQFDVQQGEKGVTNNLAALGLKGSGAALKALTTFRQGLADRTYQTYLDRLSGASVGGQTQANTTAAAGTANAINVGNAATDAAAQRGSGYIAGTNAITNAIGNVSNIGSNALGWMSGNRGWAT